MAILAFIWSILVGVAWALAYGVGFVGAVGLAILVIYIVIEAIASLMGGD